MAEAARGAGKRGRRAGRRPEGGATPGGPAGAHVVIHPTAVFTRRQLEEALGLGSTTVRREVAAGRLRVARRAGWYFFLGEWVLEWIRSGERKATGGGGDG